MDVLKITMKSWFIHLRPGPFRPQAIEVHSDHAFIEALFAEPKFMRRVLPVVNWTLKKSHERYSKLQSTRGTQPKPGFYLPEFAAFYANLPSLPIQSHNMDMAEHRENSCAFADNGSLRFVPVVTSMRLIILIQPLFRQTEVLRLSLPADESCGKRLD